MAATPTFSSTEEETKRLFEEKYITAQQLADHVGVSRVSVFKARTGGKLPNAVAMGATYIWERAYIMPIVNAWKETVKLRSGAEE